MPAISTLLDALPVFGNLASTINTFNDQKRTPLQDAAESEFTEIIGCFLSYRIRGGFGEGNLQQAGELAAARGDSHRVKLFLSSAEGITGHEFFQVACRVGQALMVEHLLRDQLVSPNGDGSDGSAPILLEISKGHSGMVHTLLRYKALVKIVDTQRKTLYTTRRRPAIAI